MGTNFYHKKLLCDHCGNTEEIHIGKSSAGWVFSLATHPEFGLNSLDDWMERFRGGGVISDEYGNAWTPNQMLEIITVRGTPDPVWDDPRRWALHGGWEAHFHRSNNSMRGPRGLLRHQLSHFCVGHGEGTWDYMSGEFS